MVSTFRLQHTQFRAGFVCNFLSSSTGFNLCSCFFRLTLAFYFRFWLLWALHSTVLPASFRLSDPRCFRFLSSASVLGSDYSASVSSFPSLPGSASQWLSQCTALTFAPSVFPVLSCLVSHAVFPGSCTRRRCLFPFTLPRFAPTAVPRVLTFLYRFRPFSLSLRFLSSPLFPVLAT